MATFSVTFGDLGIVFEDEDESLTVEVLDKYLSYLAKTLQSIALSQDNEDA